MNNNRRKITRARSVRLKKVPSGWREPCANTECSLHQLSPYIGKIKSSIAAALVERYSSPGELVLDPFAGAGTIPLEAVLRGRRALASDISSYARVLSLAKLTAPKTVEDALKLAEDGLEEAKDVSPPDLRSVPSWVRRFFHRDTLREALQFARVARRPGNEFLMACFLGILHHQRPGFLSYPSSHLVPYLRNKKFPPKEFPELYGYRELKPRLLAKVRRSYKRAGKIETKEQFFIHTPIQSLALTSRVDAIITSPPYMNALDYGRDNRLRLWFIEPGAKVPIAADVTKRRDAFVEAITSLADLIELRLRPSGYCVVVVGEEFRRSFEAHPSRTVKSVMASRAPSVRLQEAFTDEIPDVRRTRHECKGVKSEHFLIFRKGAT